MRFWGRIAAVLVAVAPLIWFSPVHAQTSKNWTVTTCGTAPSGFSPSGSGYTAGAAYPQVMDVNGNLCTAAVTTATVAFVATTTTNASTTITTGGTFQSALASNGSRKGCLIQNPVAATETLYVYFGATGSATTANSIALGAGSAVSCAVGGLGVATDNVAVEAATTGHAFVEMSQ